MKVTNKTDVELMVSAKETRTLAPDDVWEFKEDYDLEIFNEATIICEFGVGKGWTFFAIYPCNFHKGNLTIID